MVFWRRIKQSQIHTKLWSQFSTTRSFTLVRSPVTITADPTRIWPLNSPRLPVGKLQLELPTNVRFFAKKKVKSKPKPKPKVVDELRPRLNEEITEDVIRLVEGEEGQTHTVMPTRKALELANELGLDLVEVQRNSNPPVCKIRDYLKDKYKQQTKDKERAKEKSAVSLRQGACKEIRFSAKISQKDLEVKVDQAKRLMEQGYRVKCLAIGDSSKENGESSTKLLSRFAPLMEDCAITESHNRVEDKDQIHVILRHVKFGLLKKGSGKKAAVSNVKSAKETDDTEVEEEVKPSWTAAVSSNDDFDKIFDVTENPGNDGREPSRPLPRFSSGPSQPQFPSGPSQPQFPSGPRQPQFPSGPSQPQFTNGPRQPQFPNGPRQPQPSPQIHFPPNLNNNGRSSAPDFGIFTPGELRTGPAQVNRYKPTTGSEPQQNQTGPAQVNRYKQTTGSEPQQNQTGPAQVNRYKQTTGSQPQQKQTGPAQVNRYKQMPGSEPHRSPAPPRPPVGHENRGIPNTRDGSGQERSSYYR